MFPPNLNFKEGFNLIQVPQQWSNRKKYSYKRLTAKLVKFYLIFRSTFLKKEEKF